MLESGIFSSYLCNMNTALITKSQLAPQFDIPTNLPIQSNITSILLGQARLQSAFTIFKQLHNQHLYIADQQGINRQLLIKSLVDENEYKYLNGVIRRQSLIGYKHNDLWQHGLLAQPITLFICVESLLKREPLWELLIDALLTNKIEISSGNSIPLRAKIILIGNADIYAGLRYQDNSFNQLFPLLGEMATELNINEYSIDDYCQWLYTLASELALTIDNDAMTSILTYASKLTEHQQRLSLLTDELSQLFIEASTFTENQLLTKKAIETAIEQKSFRHNTSELYSAQSFDDAFINLLTQGEEIGQINGLTVIDSVDFCYGEPARITASVHYGDGEVADIERKSELGGNIHAKGLMILTACLYRIFGRDEPLHLNANIVFEQSYQEIDGDSASLAEYCCLISAISEKAIRQDLAITGALDQMGHVQAIGGVNEKIEGFYNLCERRGLTGTQGVIIPKANLLQLNLPSRIINAIENKQFTLYQVSHMDEAVELLMQMPAGKANEINDFPENTLYGLVQERLDKLAGNIDDEIGFWTKFKARLGLSI